MGICRNPASKSSRACPAKDPPMQDSHRKAAWEIRCTLDFASVSVAFYPPGPLVKVLISLEINVLCNHRLMVSAAEPTHRKKFINFEDFSCVGEVPGLESPRSRIVHASSVSLLWGTPASQALTKTQIRTTNTIP
jgi:hypothetical protein